LQEQALQKEHRALVNIKFPKQTILVVHQFSNSSKHSNQCFGSGSGLDPNSIGSAVPDPGKPNGPQKGKKKGISCLKSLNVLCRGLRRHIWRVLNKKLSNYIPVPIFFFTNFVIINLGLDPDQIRIQQQAGSGSGFRKIHGSGFGFSEYGSETLTVTAGEKKLWYQEK
jgi:hypothetical protein